MSGHSQNEDDAAFKEAMEGVSPLETDSAEPYRKRRAPLPLPKEREPEDGEDLVDLSLETGDFLEFRRPGIQNRLFRDLQRGLLETEATLDMHGMRVVDARKALVRFLAHSSHLGLRCVRIIHGKGRSSPNEQPVLKQKTNQWLRQREEVLAFCTAPRWDGGTGAVYVLMRRSWQGTR